MRAVAQDSEIVQNEVFGPVLVVLPVDDDVQSVYRYLISGQAQGAS